MITPIGFPPPSGQPRPTSFMQADLMVKELELHLEEIKRGEKPEWSEMEHHALQLQALIEQHADLFNEAQRELISGKEGIVAQFQEMAADPEEISPGKLKVTIELLSALHQELKPLL